METNLNGNLGCKNLEEVLKKESFFIGLEDVLRLSEIEEDVINNVVDIFKAGLDNSKEKDLKEVRDILTTPSVQTNSKTFLRKLSVSSKELSDYMKQFINEGYDQVVDKVIIKIIETLDLGIGKIQKFYRYGRIIGEKGVAKVDMKTLKLEITTGDLGIGKIQRFYEDGRIVGEKGVAKVNKKTLELEFTTLDLGIGKIQEFYLYGNGEIEGEEGVAKVDMETLKLER